MSTNVPNLKQIGGGHRKNGQKFVDLMWNDPSVNDVTPPELPEDGAILSFVCRVDYYDVNYDVANDRGLMYH